MTAAYSYPLARHTGSVSTVKIKKTMLHPPANFKGLYVEKCPLAFSSCHIVFTFSKFNKMDKNQQPICKLSLKQNKSSITKLWFLLGKLWFGLGFPSILTVRAWLGRGFKIKSCSSFQNIESFFFDVTHLHSDWPTQTTGKRQGWHSHSIL